MLLLDNVCNFNYVFSKNSDVSQFFFRDYNCTAFFKNRQDLENSAELAEGDFQTI